MKKAPFIIGSLVLAVAAALFFFTDLLAPREARTPDGARPLAAYESGLGGFSFEYPDTYVAVDASSEDAERIGATLYDRAAWERVMAAEFPTEYPPGISVVRFANTEGLPFQVWLRESPYANFAEEADPSSVVLAGGVGTRYRWSGLYEGESVALYDLGVIYLLSVTYFDPGDPIRADFETVLDTFIFTPQPMPEIPEEEEAPEPEPEAQA